MPAYASKPANDHSNGCAACASGFHRDWQLRSIWHYLLSYNRRISALIHRLRIGCYNIAMGCYHQQWSVIDVNSRGWFSVSTSIDHSLVCNFYMSCAATDVSNWLLQLVLVLYKHRSRRSIIHQLLSAYSSRLLLQIKWLIRWRIGKFDRMIKRLSHGCFHIGPISSPLSTTILGYAMGSYRHSGLIYGPIWKKPCDNL